MTIRGTNKNGIPSYQTQDVLIDPIIYGTAAAAAAREDDPLLKSNNHEDFAEPVFRDVPWAIAFLAHLAAMIYLGVAYGSFGVQHVDWNTTDWKEELEASIDDDKVLHQMEAFAEAAEEYVQVFPQRILSYVVIPCALLASVFSYVGTAFVIPSCAKFVVQTSLIGSIGWTILLTIFMSVASHSWFVYLMSAGMIAVMIYYVSIVWRLIPFAAVNLEVSLKGISANWGMYILAFLFSVAGFVWTIFWIYVAIGVLGHETLIYNKEHSNNASGDENDDVGPQGFTVFFLLVSLYWTSTVLLNTVQVTVAGVMGTWCFDKQDADSCCSPAVTSSLYRSVTYSFGSICFGSLVQAIMTALRVLVENARNQRDNQQCEGGGALLLCILECIIQLLEDIVEYFNQWAYVFVGIYGYSYLDSGRKVMELFRARGWTSIITNSLVGFVLGFTSFSVAIVTGLTAVAIDAIVSNAHTLGEGELSYVFGPLPGHGYYAFFLGLILGIAVSSVMMNVVKGAVNTLIVCFADAPAKLEENHPRAARDIAESWSSVFPDVVIRPASYSAVV